MRIKIYHVIRSEGRDLRKIAPSVRVYMYPSRDRIINRVAKANRSRSSFRRVTGRGETFSLGLFSLFSRLFFSLLLLSFTIPVIFALTYCPVVSSLRSLTLSFSPFWQRRFSLASFSLAVFLPARSHQPAAAVSGLTRLFHDVGWVGHRSRENE
jgi:hypothetical protein